MVGHLYKYNESNICTWSCPLYRWSLHELHRFIVEKVWSREIWNFDGLLKSMRVTRLKYWIVFETWISFDRIMDAHHADFRKPSVFSLEKHIKLQTFQKLYIFVMKFVIQTPLHFPCSVFKTLKNVGFISKKRILVLFSTPFLV